MNEKTSNARWILLFLLPIIFLYTAFFIYPFGFVFFSSLNKWNGISHMKFIGLQNYINLAKSTTFQLSIRNNIVWALSLGFLQVGFATVIAFILARRPRFWKGLRTVYFIPKVISGVAIAMLWKAVYNAEFGALNAILSFMIIILAGVMAIPRSYYEAAEIDGASVLQQELHITLPVVWGTIVTAMTLAMAYGLRHFEATFLMTGGGPGHSTSTLAIMMYNKIGARKLGQASALGTVLVIIGFIVIVTLNSTLGRKSLTGEDT